MEFKKRMLSEYSVKLNEILDSYRTEYQQIVKSMQMPQNIVSSTTPQSPSDTIKNTEENKECKEENKENIISTNVQGVDRSISFTADGSTSAENANEFENFDYTKFSKPDTSLAIENENGINVESRAAPLITIQTDAQTTDIRNSYSIFQTASLNMTNYGLQQSVGTDNINYADQKGTKQAQLDNFSMLENPSNYLNSSINQSFINSEFRRKARRRTGRMIIKRKLEVIGGEEDCFKRRRTDAVGSFLVLYYDLLKNKNFGNKYEKEIEELKLRLRKAEASETSKIEQERKNIEKMKNENLEISQKIEKELSDLKLLKETISKEFERIKEDKRNLQAEREKIHLEKMHNERKFLEDEYRRKTIRLEAEKTMISEERKKLEEMRRLEMAKIQEEIKRLQMEKAEEIRKIMEEKALLEKQFVDQSIHMENERKLLREEQEKTSQTMLESTTKRALEASRQKDVEIKLPDGKRMEIQKKDTIVYNGRDEIKSKFKMAMKNYDDRISQSQLVDPSKQPSKELQYQVFTKQASRKQQVKMENEKIDAHFLYKRSIDAQIFVADTKKYVPKLVIPFYSNEDEFESEDKKFVPALFTKDPKLNYIVKTQDHNEVRKFFGDKRDIDVEGIFSQIENVSNYSPNKLKSS
ncbi:uncharacterized protein VICG_02024 [Vittaforma corneae ATCC 50505]|uniref:Uncharacterized protein n=1 Tax=Vittaforma corneae (strain ATCC 50505) TaxID=993615 RepID=L2GK96_VITCO|nr:uncharacterized protein VICG_02024 [Vittaforma corneae ATCC 50505]ELA40935.1 hypothetical protein VICG_02024 [Vittaforma corneae ATCC 50505]